MDLTNVSRRPALQKKKTGSGAERSGPGRHLPRPQGAGRPVRRQRSRVLKASQMPSTRIPKHGFHKPFRRSTPS